MSHQPKRTQISARALPSYKKLRLRQTIHQKSIPSTQSQLDPQQVVSLQQHSNDSEPSAPNHEKGSTPSPKESQQSLDDIDDDMPSSGPITLSSFADDEDELIDPLQRNQGNTVIGYDVDDDEDDDSDDLLRELEKIKEEQQQRQIEQIKQEAQINANVSIMDNPLLRDKLEEITKGTIKSESNLSSSSSQYAPSAVLGVRKWQDDAVFTQQAAGLNPRGDYNSLKKQRYINDTTRSDFHREFLATYFK